MKNKKGNKLFLCYFGLVILIILLLLPICLRLFGKNLYEKKENSDEEIIEVLNCNKDNSTINSTFLNGTPQNLLLKIKGDQTTIKETNKSDTSLTTDDSTNDTVSRENDLVKYIRNYSMINYSKEDDTTSFKVNMTDLKQIDEYIVLFNNLENQQKYFTSQAFSCTVVKY